MKVPSLVVAQHFTDEGTRSCDWCPTPLFNDDCHTDHVACSQYVKLQVFVGFWCH
jgi:hypothetical protein